MKKGIISLYVIICLGMLLFAGCASADTNNKTNTEKKDPVVEETNDKTNKDQVVEEAFADANDMLKSADLYGTASGCSDTGCTISSISFASIEDDGTSSSVDTVDTGSNGIIYTNETIFQRAKVDSNGSSYSISDGRKNELKDGDIILCFGNQQADGTYLAEKIIMIEFNYD